MLGLAFPRSPNAIVYMERLNTTQRKKYNNNNNNNKRGVWNVKTKVKIVVTGIILKSCTKYLSNIPGKHKIKELQKTAN
jgi:hypothetical protein